VFSCFWLTANPAAGKPEARVFGQRGYQTLLTLAPNFPEVHTLPTAENFAPGRAALATTPGQSGSGWFSNTRGGKRSHLGNGHRCRKASRTASPARTRRNIEYTRLLAQNQSICP